VTRAYGVPVVGGGSGTTDALRSRVARGRPNWWVILAVSLALIALLVVTSGGTPHGTGRRPTLANAASGDARPRTAGHGTRTTTATRALTTSTTTTTEPVPESSALNAGGSDTSLLTTRTAGQGSATPTTGAPSATTTTLPPSTTTTTTTIPSASLPADRTQTQGYLDPPLQTFNRYGFTGTGAMEISVLWSDTTYLTMSVSCPSGSQSVGGTAAMAASLPDASGSCLATVSEPASETASLTYTITIGPAGG
jgi:hypothetical protein